MVEANGKVRSQHGSGSIEGAIGNGGAFFVAGFCTVGEFCPGER